MFTRIFFVCYPDTNHPIGGVKQIYRQAELLSDLGFRSYVLHHQPNFRVSWFSSDANVISLAEYCELGPDSSSDVIVLPETWVNNIPTYFSGISKIIFNQNAYYTFGVDDFDKSTLSHYRHPDVIGVLTVSRDNLEYLVRGCCLPRSTIHYLINGIDSSIFYPPSIKHRRICYLKRKHFNHAHVVAHLASLRPRLSGYGFHLIERCTHHELAKQLRESLIFLSCGHPEGFGLPLAEAIASGCIVVGYHGLAGRDFCSPALHHVEFGDILSFVDQLETCIDLFENDTVVQTQKLLEYSRSILTKYDLASEQDFNSSVWRTLLSS